MSETLVFLLGDAPHWLRIEDDRVVARGEGFVRFPDPDARTVAVVPAHDVVVHYAELPELAEPQARAAARLLVAEQSASSIETLHVALGRGNAERPIVAIATARMAAFLVDLAARGIDPDVVLAAPLLVARPDEGYVRATIGGEPIVRGRDSAFADDAVLQPLLTGGEVTTLDAREVDRQIITSVADPEVDLRQGVFAKRRRWGIDWKLVRRIGWLLLAVVTATLLLQIVQIVRLNNAANRLEANSAIAARAVLPPGATVNNALIQVQEQLASLRGPGGGFLPLAAAVATAANTTPDVELTSMIFDGGGTLRVTARAASPAALSTFDARLASGGLTSAPGPILVDQGRQIRDYTVSAK